MNQLHGFLLQELDIRGQHVLLQESWREMIADRHYTPALQRLLGELTAVAVFLANGLKHEGKVTLQVQGQGPVSLLVVEATHDLAIRGMAKTREAISEELEGMDALLGEGQLVLTLYNSVTDRHYQSFVPRHGNSVAESFEHFFSQSDQLDTRLWLTANDQAVGGLLLQKMPEADKKDPDGWSRVVHLAETLKDEELLTLPAQELLHRLFHEETVELYPPREVRYECTQDRDRVLAAIKAMGEEEVRRILEQEGAVVVHNELCNFHVKLDAADVDALFSAEKPQQ
ncbi:molecular chaperone Hsp33 [Sulfurivirga caldicuralii]|uniref:Molecular chaperone Hsp33 n=1 Tax=Sulfurivirga caldicuralii TaxID=364032 RepID=A0A1N6G4Y6_9GAMM|nr:Hsp33 family molecular chaperone HslO [Sulfurivirga caldicuralii]SIO02570.1 molecular chaperone Hsp33 [Sulfurivirga caldicuralii]